VGVLSRQERPVSGRLLVRTVAVPDPGDLLERIPQPDVVAWVHHGAGLVGWGEAVRVTLPAGEDRFTAGEKWLRSVFDAADVDDRVRVRGSGPVAFGTFTFDASSDGSVLIVPRVILGRDGRGLAWLTTVTEPGETPPSGWPEGGTALTEPEGELLDPSQEAVLFAISQISGREQARLERAADVAQQDSFAEPACKAFLFPNCGTSCELWRCSGIRSAHHRQAD